MSTIRDVSTLLGYVESGRAIRALNDKMSELMERLHGLSLDAPKKAIKGSLNIKIGFELVNGAITITAEGETKAPKDPPGSAMFFITRDGEISTEHPTQLDMLREVKEPDAPGIAEAMSGG